MVLGLGRNPMNGDARASESRCPPIIETFRPLDARQGSRRCMATNRSSACAGEGPIPSPLAMAPSFQLDLSPGPLLFTSA